MTKPRPTFSQVSKSDGALIHAAAVLMSSSDPWKRLGFSQQQCEQNLLKDQIQVHALVEDGKLLAFMATLEHGIGFEPMIEYLCVDESLRGKGIGTAFIGYFERELFEKEDNLYMFVSDINPRAKALYGRLGYHQVGVWPDYNLKGQTEYLMRKTRGPKQERREK